MKISQAAIASGVTVKAIRHYEAKGLLDKVQRRGKYREFSSSDVERLRLIARCRRPRDRGRPGAGGRRGP